VKKDVKRDVKREASLKERRDASLKERRQARKRVGVKASDEAVIISFVPKIKSGVFMEKSGYKNVYFQVVKKENTNRIKLILNETGYYDENTVEKIMYEEKDDSSYFSLIVDSAEHIGRNAYAMLDGIFVKIDSIVQQWKGYFYLPILITREIKDETLQSFVNSDMHKDHELHHLQHIIEHIDKHPEYIENSRKYNAGGCSYDDIEKSIEFEINKLFLFELPAFVSEFEQGERNIFMRSKDLVSMVALNDKNEFVLHNLGHYIENLKRDYIARFHDKRTEINKFMDREVHKQGETLFGANIMEQIAMVILKSLLLEKINGTHFEIKDYED